MNALKQATPENKGSSQLAGLTVQLEGDTCRCGSETAVINHDNQLTCRGCNRPRGWLSQFRRDWILAVIAEFGRAEAIIIRGPRL